MSRIHERILASCAKRGLSRADYALLCAARYRINLPPESFVRQVSAESEGRPEPVPSVEELERAVESLCERGLLTVLSPEDVEQETQRVLESALPELREGYYGPGEVDFTPTGYHLFRELVLEVFGPEHLATYDSGFRFEPTSQTFVVMASTRKLCLRRIEEIRAYPQCYTGSETPSVVAEVSEPEPIGPWMPNRFVQLERGFRSTVRLSEGR